MRILHNPAPMSAQYRNLLQRIAARIHQRRRELGMSQEELAGDEYTKSFVSQIEKGTVWPSLPALAYFSERLGRPVAWFVADEIPYRKVLHEVAHEAGVDPEQVLLVLAAVMRRL